MFTIQMLPGDYGDALWIEYGDPQRPARILIDGGAPGTGRILRQRLNALPADQRRFDLIVVTHIDLDHISGVLELLERDPPQGLAIGDFFFNGYDKLPDPEGILGPKQGERLSFWIRRHGLPCNEAFSGKAVMLPDDLSLLPVIDLPQDMKITLLSPTKSRLLSLRSEWEQIIEGLELVPGQAGATLAGHPEEAPLGVLGGLDVEAMAGVAFNKDDSKPNASSIAFLADYDGKSILFTGDAFADDLTEGIRKHLANTGKRRLVLDGWKLSHHGGKKNTSPELIQLIQCRRYLVPTSGARYHHPNAETLSRILVNKPASDEVCFHFNYRSDENKVWDNDELKRHWNYQTVFPRADRPGGALRL